MSKPLKLPNVHVQKMLICKYVKVKQKNVNTIPVGILVYNVHVQTESVNNCFLCCVVQSDPCVTGSHRYLLYLYSKCSYIMYLSTTALCCTH